MDKIYKIHNDHELFLRRLQAFRVRYSDAYIHKYPTDFKCFVSGNKGSSYFRILYG